jgi:hypothetical protein
MTTEWVITAPAERVKLSGANQGETSFTVTNPGTAPDRVVFELVAGDGATDRWFAVEEPQRVVAGGASVSYLVKIVVPAGIPAGEYWLQARAYSADTAPEEGSRLSGRVAFDVAQSAKPKRRPWWPYAVAAGLILAVLIVVGVLVLGDDEPDTVTQDCISGFVWREAVPGDRVCVTPATRDQAKADNELAVSRRNPNGGPFGVNTCLQGFVWREATPEDFVCVLPEVRELTRADNAAAESRRLPSATG